MNILEELYYGNIVPTEKCAKLNSEVTELLKLLQCLDMKELRKRYRENEKSIQATFEKYKDCNREISEICEKDAFLNGFRLGARIIIESVNQ